MQLARPLRLVVLAALVAAARAAVYDVGSGQAYANLGALPALAPGDEVRVHAGTYHEVHRFTQGGTAGNRIWIHGVDAQRPVFDGTGFTVDGSLPNPRAVLQVEASYLTLERLEMRNAANGHNGAAVRITTFGAMTVGTVIRDCRLTACEDGIMSDTCDDTLLERCEIDHNGVDDYSHNCYFGGGTTTLVGCWIHHSLSGINLKSRAHYTAIVACRIEASADGEVDLVDAAETAAANSNALILGCVIASAPRGPSHNHVRFIHWGHDQGLAHNGTLYACFNTFQAADTSIGFFFPNSSGAPIVASGNVFAGSQTIVSSPSAAVTGVQNWVPSGSATPAGFSGTLSGADPLLAGGGDPRPLVGSPLIDAGPIGATSVDGSGATHAATPTQEYLAPLAVATRASDGHPDIGAYEATPGTGTTSGGTTTAGTSSGGTTTGGTGTGGTTTGATTTGGTSGSGTSTGAVVHGGAQGSHGCGHGAALAVAALAIGLARRRGA